MIQCEFSHAIGKILGNFREYFDLTRKYPMYQGGYDWGFIDRGLKINDDSGLIIFADKVFTASVLSYTACEMENAENETLFTPFKT